MTDARAFRIAALAIGAITLLRIAVLFASQLDLYPDEAQYWWWAQHPAFGYFSKPPFIAWLIAAVTSLCGDGEACIRLASPLLHGATAFSVFALAKLLYDARVGLLSALLYVSAPGVSYSAGLISTDVPLLFFWAVALLAFVKAMRATGRASYGWAALCGAAIGFGLLSKYAMLYFVLGAGLATLISREARRLILGPRGALIVLLATLIIVPNLMWNTSHGFATVAHTAANANWRQGGLRPFGPIEFLVSQFGVFGPLVMVAYLYSVWRVLRRRGESDAGPLLVCFSLPALAVIVCQAAIADANANWAAPAYIAATPLAARVLMDVFKGVGLALSLVLNALVMVAVMLFALSPSVAADLGFANAYKRLQGWHSFGARVAEVAAAGRYDAIVADNRSVMAELLYYARPRSLPVLMWSKGERVVNHFAMTTPLTVQMKGRVLLVTNKADPSAVLATFRDARLRGDIVIDVGGGIERITHLYEAEGYRGPSVSDRHRSLSR